MTKNRIQVKYRAVIFDWTEVNDNFERFISGRYHVTLKPEFSWDGTFATSGTCRCFDSLSSADHYLSLVRRWK